MCLNARYSKLQLSRRINFCNDCGVTKLNCFLKLFVFCSGKNNETSTSGISGKIREDAKGQSTIPECPEKSESLTSKASSPSSSEKSSSEKIDQKSSVSEPKPPVTTASRFTTCTVTSPTSTKPPLRRRHTAGPGMTFPATDPPCYSSSMIFSRTSPLPSPHLDKRFFDSSLIEMKSQASSSSTIDNDSTEEIWIRRVDFIQERKRQVSQFFTSSFK